MIWISRLLTALEIFFVIKAITRRGKACPPSESSKTESYTNASMSNKTDLKLSFSYTLTHPKHSFGPLIDSKNLTSALSQKDLIEALKPSYGRRY